MKKHIMLASLIGMSFGVQAQHIPSTIDSIFAPVKVATPPSDAYIGLSRLVSVTCRGNSHPYQRNAFTRIPMNV